MNLAIDIGSTLSKVAAFEEDELLEVRTFDGLHVESLSPFWEKNQIPNTIVSSVGDFRQDVKAYLEEKSQLVILTETLPIPIKNCYKSSDTLGKDRLAGVIGANALYQSENILVIDIGTCITYDFINNKNEFLGGAISPGLNIRFKALNDYTFNLPRLERGQVENFIGGNTKESILSGVINGMAHEINGTVESYQNQFDNLKIVVTGGDYPFFESYFKSTIFAVPNLVLHGLNKILRYNAS